MNFYIVVEGSVGEKKVYAKWINYIHPHISLVKYYDEIQKDNFYIISGFGYPNYFQIIESAIADVNNADNIDRLVISTDSEDMAFEEKFHEITNFLKSFSCKAEIKLIIQHFCLETWALGNKRVGPRNPKSATLRKYKALFNVLDKDPELLPQYPPENLNRAQFAEKYLRLMLNDKFKNLTYTKNNPASLLHSSYFNELKKRYDNTNHISSFSTFINAFL